MPLSRQVRWPSAREAQRPSVPELPPGWRLCAATPAHLERLVDMHVELMPDDLLPSLGRSLLASSFWPRLLSSPHAQVWVALDADAEAAGFAVMARRRLALRLGFYADAAFCLQMLMRLLRHPARLWRGVVTLLAPIRLRMPLGPVPAELILLGVTPAAQGKGVGRQLLLYALHEVGPVACLVKTASDDARRFYQRAGFVSQGYELRDIRPLHWLVRPSVLPGR